MDDSRAALISYAGRLDTFQQLHHLAKRRASSQKKKTQTQNTLSWPHSTPTPEDLARAGFFYRPSSDSNDNCQCFMCGVKLDGWESGDIPLLEHLAHSSGCGWALSLSVVREDEDRDPMSEEMIEARRATYGTFWPHELKKGWKCKTQKMIEAGWSYDPGPEAEDGVTCFYCNLSLDGWEPKDNPMDEHAKRSQDCPFFALVEQYAATAVTKPSAKSKKGRLSRASKGSRLSTQSVQSTFSEAPSLMSLGDAGVDHDMAMDDSVAVDNSVVSVATNTSTTKGRKKGAKGKASAKGKKKAGREESVEPTVTYPSHIDTTSQALEPEEPVMSSTPPPAPAEVPPMPVEPPPKARGRKAKAKATEDSQMEDSSMMDQAPKGKKGRGRPKKVSATAQHLDESQLQSELEIAASFTSMDQSFPIEHLLPGEQTPPNAKRGVKRTSEGTAKIDSTDISAAEEAAPPKKKPGRPAAKGKKGKKAAKDTQEESQADVMEIEPMMEEELAVATMQEEPTEPTPPKAKKKRGRPSKQAQSQPEPESSQEPEPEPVEEVTADVSEEIAEDIPAVASTPAISVRDEEPEPEPAEEFEPTPTPQKPRSSHISLPPANPSPSSLPSPASESAHSTPRSARSQQSSDAENHPPPSTVRAPRTAIKPTPLHLSPTQRALFPQPNSILTSPTKTTTVPLAVSTPQRSPGKTLAQLTSATPWVPADLETVFLTSPQKDGDVGERLLDVGGRLSSPEKKMSVEEWVRWRAEMGEEKLRKECERLVSAFEKQGAKAQASLGGIQVV